MTTRRGLLFIAAAVIVALVTWWVWPSDSAPAQRMTAGPYRVELTVGDGSAHTGDISAELEITDQQGKPAAPDRVSVEPAMPQMGHAVPPATATTVTPGHYRAVVNLPMPGQWEIAVNLSGPQGSGRATFSVRAN
ncbi:FixH family protein [Nocardia sp. NPDC006630]|uniref:FixH family protein n=1 Tax=Nocardia sp. NPDC006630 TaxID=3157181 RepID=UPI0033A3482B